MLLDGRVEEWWWSRNGWWVAGHTQSYEAAGTRVMVVGEVACEEKKKGTAAGSVVGSVRVVWSKAGGTGRTSTVWGQPRYASSLNVNGEQQ